jgi:hypothetical protein
LLFGHDGARGSSSEKRGNKWQSRPSTHLQNDYAQLLVLLFTEEFETSSTYRKTAKAHGMHVEPPETRLDTIKRIWEYVLPSRTLHCSAGKVEVYPLGQSNKRYNGAEMSDGERVVFYLIGQSLATKRDGILVIDEPELHLHRAIQARLWDAIEAERPDCLFIYLTHDLDFAATRVNAEKIWIKGYEDQKWDWVVLDPSGPLPERLLLETIGSRRPILFVEGDRESLDSYVMARLYPAFNVVPCGTADAVIHATKSFTEMNGLHHLECRGVVDRDFRSEWDVQHLNSFGISCLEVSEVENVIIDEAVLRVTAESLHREDADDIIARAKELVFRQMAADRDRLVSALVARRIEQQFRLFDAKALGAERLAASVNEVLSRIAVEPLFDETKADIDGVLSRRDCRAALKVYNNKGLLPTVAPLFGFKPHELAAHVRRLLASKQNAALIDALRPLFPVLDTRADRDGNRQDAV